MKNWPDGKEESSFVSVTTKTSIFLLIICLSCSNLLFIVFIFKLPNTSLLVFLIFKLLRELERLFELNVFSSALASSVIQTFVTLFLLVGNIDVPEFTTCE